MAPSALSPKKRTNEKIGFPPGSRKRRDAKVRNLKKEGKSQRNELFEGKPGLNSKYC